MPVMTIKAPSGKHIWHAVRDELMLNLYPLPFSTLAPTVYHIYLHPDDFVAVEPIASRIVAEIEKALTTEVASLNDGMARQARRVLARLLKRDELPPIEVPTSGWEIHIQADRNGDIARGQLGIVSTLAMPAPATFGGTPTTRIVKSVVSGGKRTSSTTDVPQPEAPPHSVQSAAPAPALRGTPETPRNVPEAPREVQPARSTAQTASRSTDASERARLIYQDDRGPHLFIMRKDAISGGRGGNSAWVDVQIAAASKVSREHFRIRRDADGRFFIQDVSLWGTFVNGTPVPPAVKTAEGVTQPGPEQPLPPKARIGLADVIEIEFDATNAP
jgi:pSer/pThr/pTyr-binding forkhead associated (FHA) protein